MNGHEENSSNGALEQTPASLEPRNDDIQLQAPSIDSQANLGFTFSFPAYRITYVTRIPTVDEYEYLSILGDWNGVVSLDHQFWALADKKILSPDTRNPSPVRTHTEIHYAEVNFYCVK